MPHCYEDDRGGAAVGRARLPRLSARCRRSGQRARCLEHQSRRLTGLFGCMGSSLALGCERIGARRASRQIWPARAMQPTLRRRTSRTRATAAEQQARLGPFPQDLNDPSRRTRRSARCLQQAANGTSRDLSNTPRSPGTDDDHVGRKGRSRGEIAGEENPDFLREAMIGEPVGMRTKPADWLVVSRHRPWHSSIGAARGFAGLPRGGRHVLRKTKYQRTVAQRHPAGAQNEGGIAPVGTQGPCPRSATPDS